MCVCDTIKTVLSFLEGKVYTQVLLMARPIMCVCDTIKTVLSFLEGKVYTQVLLMARPIKTSRVKNELGYLNTILIQKATT